MNAKQLLKDAEQRLMTEYHKDLKHATAQELHNAVSGAAMDALAPVWTRKEAARFPRRQAAYLPWSFLWAVWFTTTFTVWACWMM